MVSRIPEDINPGLGRIGICAAGAARGQYILLLSEAEYGWDLFFSLPWESFLGSDEVGDLNFAPDYIIEMVLEENDIRWIPIAEDDEIERRIFDLRKGFLINHVPFWRRMKQCFIR